MLFLAAIPEPIPEPTPWWLILVGTLIGLGMIYVAQRIIRNKGKWNRG